MNFPGFYSDSHNFQSLPVRKNSDMIREAQATFSVLPHKEAEDLRDFLTRNSDNIRTYDLTEENLRLLKQLRKCPSFISAIECTPAFEVFG